MTKHLIIWLLLSSLFCFSPSFAKEKVKKRNFVKLNIVGANKALKENIESFLSLGKPECNVDQKRIKRYLDTLEKTLPKAARPLGYYNSKFMVVGQRKRNCWLVNINAIPGKAIYVKAQDIKIAGAGKHLQVLQKIINKPPYRSGEQLQQNKYEDWKSSLLKAAIATGYLNGKFETNEIRVNLDRRQANIVLHFNTGNVHRFGKIRIEQPILKPKYMRRFIQLKPGEVYSSEELIKQQQYLQSTGYFSEVLIKPDHQRKQDDQTNIVPVKITLTPKKRNTYEYRLGYGTDTGPRALATLDRHWTGSKGRKFKAKIKASEAESLVEAKYIVPLQHPKTENVSYTFKFSEEQTDDIETYGFNFKADYTRKNTGQWQQSAFIKYLFDYTKTEGQSYNQSKFTLLGLSVEKSEKDHPVNPRKARKASLEIQGGHGELLSDDNFAQAVLKLNAIEPLGKGKVLARLSLGSTMNDNFDHLPKSLRFFAGGNKSVRGYDYESLGEQDDKGKIIGGKNLITSSLEYEHPIKKDWGVAAFIDAGGAFNTSKKRNLKAGAGLGARWNSPIGPVKVDLAVPREDKNDLHFYLNVGADF